MTQIKFKKILAGLAVVLLTTGLLVSQASATVMPPDCVFTFDKVGTGSNVLGPASFGTMSLTDTGNTIQVAFAGSLTSWSITRIFLNYDFGSGPAIGPSLTYSTATAGVLSNSVNMDGYTSAGFFDMQLAGAGPLPTSGTLQLNGGAINIDASLFNLPTFGDSYAYDIYAGLLLDSGTLGRRWVFASTVECATAPVPEPSTLLLLGGGLAGLAGVTWRRRKKA